MTQLQSRNHGLDLLRVLACYMVLQVHAGEFYYIADGGLVAAGGEPVWACWLNSLCRTAVPLFVMLSGFFLLPVRERTRDFFARRFVRVVVPFLVWCVLYAIYQFLTGRTDAAGALLGVCRIPVNFGVEIGHLWFVYMLLGLYLFAPVVSPWIETASRRAMEGYLALWAFTLCIPYVHLVFPELLGECFWNDTPMLYYFSGFLGYMVLAAYLRRYHAAPRAWHKWGGALLVVAGYFATAWIFDARLATQRLVADLELSWGFGTINVAAMSVGLFLLLKDVRPGAGRFTGVVTDISRLSYGIYLIHIMLLNFFHGWLDPLIVSAGIKIPVLALCTFVSSYAVVKLISLLPGSKYVVG